jgi:hypothetical protein
MITELGCRIVQPGDFLAIKSMNSGKNRQSVTKLCHIGNKTGKT